MRIVGIAGSLRRDSVNRKLLAQVAELLPEDSEFVHWDALAEVPPFSEDTEHAPAQVVVELRTAIAAADAVVVVTPEYNGSIPGQLKNLLDWASRPFPQNCLRGKPALVLGASPSPAGAERAQAEARHVLARIGAEVFDVELPLPHADEQLFDDSGALTDATLRARLSTVLSRELVV